MAYWSDLPPELLDVIATHFDIPSDTRHFRSVCSTWRSTIPRPLPIIFPPIKFLNSNVHHCDLHLTKHVFFHLSLSFDHDAPGWLIKTEEHHPNTLRLLSPFSRTLIKQFAPNLPRNLDLTNIQIKELGHEYVLRNVSGANNMEFYNMDGANHYAILSTHNTGKLLIYRSLIEEWTFLDDYTLGYDDRSIFVNDWSLHYVDVVEFNGTFYAVTNSGRTVSIKIVDSFITITLLKNSIIGGDKKCLVKLVDQLLMIDLYTDMTPGLVKVHGVEIFKLDKEEQKWLLLKSLGEHAIFLSNHSSFSAVGLKGCKGNCIYFHFKSLDNKDYLTCSESKEGDYDKMDNFLWKSDEVGVFDFEKGIFGKLEEYLEDSRLFSWPPPSWITSACRI
ncbi:F-box protein SKIP23 [Bienertia sinuspersici]